jgi:hypothetical protein
MGATYFQNFTRGNGQPITVEYSFAPGSETTYSPANGACGGDGCEVEIIASWPNTKAFDIACKRRNDLAWSKWPLWRWPFNWIELHAVNLVIWGYERTARLATAERESFEAWIAEHHVYEDPYEPEDYL